MAKLTIAKTLAQFTNGETTLNIDCEKLAELPTAINSKFPELAESIIDQTGWFKAFICVYLNQKLIRQPQFDNHKIKQNDQLEILTALAGG